MPRLSCGFIQPGTLPLMPFAGTSSACCKLIPPFAPTSFIRDHALKTVSEWITIRRAACRQNDWRRFSAIHIDAAHLGAILSCPLGLAFFISADHLLSSARFVAL